MKSFQNSAAIAAAALVLSSSATSFADDHGKGQAQPDSPSAGPSSQDIHRDSTGTTTMAPGGAPLPGPYGTTSTTTNTNGTPTQPVGTTTTTAAPYGPMPGAEQDQDRGGPNKRVLILSSAVLLGTYGTSAIVGAANDRDADRSLLIPVAGPWVDLARRDCDAQPCNNEGASVALLIASGVLQAVGVAGVIGSFFIPDDTSGRAKATAVLAPVKPHVNVTPISVGRNGSGLGIGAVATF